MTATDHRYRLTNWKLDQSSKFRALERQQEKEVKETASERGRAGGRETGERVREKGGDIGQLK